MFSPRRPLGRLPYLALGAALFALKIAIDYALARAFGRPYSPLFYVSPTDAPLLRPGDHTTYWLAMWVVAAPFVVAGVLLTLRRLRDAALPPALALLFFVPFANLLFFAATAAVPSRPDPSPADGGARSPYRDPAPGDAPPRSLGTAVLMAGVAGAVIGLGAVGVSVGALQKYGPALMLGAPAIAGFTATLLVSRLHAPSVRATAMATTLSFALSFGVMVAFALEGAVCLIMAAPLLVTSGAVGALTAHATVVASRGSRVAATPALALLPLALVAEGLAPLPEPPSEPVESVVVVAAPPDVVWRRVIAFPPLPPPDDALFRAGVAAPLRATIDGEGVGAVRRCEFTTGAFVEPIEVWRPGRELTFSVTSQPDPMREFTLWRGPRPPHLDGFLQSTRGQFVLEPLPGGRTRLVGRTWYRVRMAPVWYWRAWSDASIHAIHMRVLRHVAALAERDARDAR